MSDPVKIDAENGGADFKILRDGTWVHDGAPIKRAALARLFSDRALKIDEQGRYWLSTPYEKYPVEVEDVPYVIVDYSYEDDALTLFSNMEERVEVGANHPLELRDGLPYVDIRGGLYARIGRSVYYNLIEEFGESVVSNGVRFDLGETC